MVSVDARQARKGRVKSPTRKPGVMGHPIRLKIYRLGHPPSFWRKVSHQKSAARERQAELITWSSKPASFRGVGRYPTASPLENATYLQRSPPFRYPHRSVPTARSFPECVLPA